MFDHDYFDHAPSYRFPDALVYSEMLAVATVLCASAIALLAVLHIRAEYLEFLALGPGGTPSTFAGFLRVNFLALFALRNRYVSEAPAIDSRWICLQSLPQRNRPRPLTKGIAPHRQMDERPDSNIYTRLAAGIEQMAHDNTADLAIGSSCFEKHGTGLFSRLPATNTCKGEIVHLHGSDGSMHLTLHPSDGKIVLDAGWGERHPLAGCYGRWSFLPRLPAGFIMLYAPQSDKEVEIVLRVISAAAAFVNGRGIEHVRSLEDGYVDKQHLGLGLGHSGDSAVHAPSILVTECGP